MTSVREERDAADWGDAAVRVTGVRRSRFVEFEFSLDADLVVELVLPYGEFREFCDEHHVRMLPADGEAALQLMELAGD
jgi:hypothetical protein